MTMEGPASTPIQSTKKCWSCGQENPAHYNFCTNCGRPTAVAPPAYKPHRPVTIRDLGRLLGIYSTLPLLAIMIVNLVILIAGIWLVYPHMDEYIHLYVITPFLVDFAKLTGGAFFGYYIFLVIAIVASFIWMLVKSLPSLAEEIRGRSPSKGPSPLFAIGTLFMAVLAFNVIFYLFVESVGTSPITPDFETAELWQYLYGFANASVWEEVVSRILLIGIPLLFIDGLRKSMNPERKMYKLQQYILGGDITIGRVEAVLLIFSSVMFGTAHVFSWDPWKIIPATVAGLAFGYLFLKFGVYAAVVLHFAFDFLSVPLAVAPDNVLLVLIVGMLSLLWMVVGTPYVVYYVSKALGWLRGRPMWPDAPWKSLAPTHTYTFAAPQYRPPTSYQPPQTGQQPYYGAPTHPTPPRRQTDFGYQCPHCGNVEASYEEGRLQCTRCGRSD